MLKPQDSFCWWRGVFLEVAHSKGMAFAVAKLAKWQANKQPTFVDSMFIKRYSQFHVKLPSGCLCVRFYGVYSEERQLEDYVVRSFFGKSTLRKVCYKILPYHVLGERLHD